MVVSSRRRPLPSDWSLREVSRDRRNCCHTLHQRIQQRERREEVAIELEKVRETIVNNDIGERELGAHEPGLALVIRGENGAELSAPSRPNVLEIGRELGLLLLLILHLTRLTENLARVAHCLDNAIDGETLELA